MPLMYSTKLERAHGSCLDCNEPVRGKKPFCDDRCKLHWLDTHHPWYKDWRGVVQVQNERKTRGINADALEWKRKLSLSRAF